MMIEAARLRYERKLSRLKRCRNCGVYCSKCMQGGRWGKCCLQVAGFGEKQE